MRIIKFALSSMILLLFAFQTLAQEGSTGFLSDLTQVKKGRTRAVTSSDPGFNSNYDRRTYIQQGETMVLCDIEGSAIINHIWLTFNDARPNWLEKYGSARPDEIVLRMYWDDGKYPAVEAPLGDFFGAGFGLRRELRSMPVLVEGGNGYNSYWQMPFFKRGRIMVTNEGEKKCPEFLLSHRLHGNGRFTRRHGVFLCPVPAGVSGVSGQGLPEAGCRRPGTLCGHNHVGPFPLPLLVWGRGCADLYRWRHETLHPGNGTEDYFLCARGLNECLFPYFGCTYMSADLSDLGVKYTLYRWHIADPIRFRRSIRFEIEHTGWISADETETGEIDGHVEREDDVVTVAFWYQTGQPKRFTTLPPLAEIIFPDLDIIVQSRGA
jgi:hypothetical protein